MGYYNGNGVVVGGGSNISVMLSGWDAGGRYVICQRVDSETVVKNGVSLAAAQSEKSGMWMNDHQWPGGNITLACKGTRASVSYSQINGSNLYSLSRTGESVAVNLNGGGWNW